MTMTEAVNHYSAAASVFSKWLLDGIISEAEYEQIDEIVASKYGLSSCSIYRRNRLTTGGGRVSMVDERRLSYA